MLTLCASWPWQKRPAQNFETVRCLFVNGFEEGIPSSQNVREANQPGSMSLAGTMGLEVNNSSPVIGAA